MWDEIRQVVPWLFACLVMIGMLIGGIILAIYFILGLIG